jgi:manganese transport protein
MLTASTEVVGDLANRRATTALAWIVAALVIGLSCFLLARSFTG